MEAAKRGGREETCDKGEERRKRERGKIVKRVEGRRNGEIDAFQDSQCGLVVLR